ncbi:MAG: S8 family serine peptidase [Chloroflexota bacterium]|nr:S8 family serine peptidase [Chloroflexota bacterium]
MKITRTVFTIIAAIILLTIVFPGQALANTSQGTEQSPAFAPDQIVVKFLTGTDHAQMAATHSQLNGKIKHSLGAIDTQVIAVPPGQAKSKLKSYQSNPNVAWAELDYVCEIAEIPDDANFASQWGLIKVEAAAAWDTTTGNPAVRVAVLDTGIDMDHPDLAGKIVASKSFSDSSTVDDMVGHGTKVAGVVAANTNNTLGVAGLGRDSSLMNGKVMSDSGSGYASWVANGIIWAADNGADVINLSLGSSASSLTMENAVDYAWGKGVVVVAAAGNAGTTVPIYPAHYPNCIAVAATDETDTRASFSTYGNWVDVAAPGVSIYTTAKGGGYSPGSGTSFASPHVAGLAALVCAVTADANGNGSINDEVRQKIEASCDALGATGLGQGRINARAAVEFLPAPPTPPSTGSIAGVVTDAETDLPISGASVTDGTRVATTSVTGSYCLTEVPAGICTVTVSKAGYGPSSVTCQVTEGEIATANFVLNAVPAADMWGDSIDFTKSGVNFNVTIRVISDSGPVAGASVNLDLSNSNKTWELSGITDAQGYAVTKVKKVSDGTYTATITSLSCDGFEWATGEGVTSATYVLGGSSDDSAKPLPPGLNKKK